MSDYSLPRYRKFPTKTIAGAVLGGFILLFSGVFYASLEISRTIQLGNALSLMEYDAMRLNALSKELLITDNLFQTYGDWRTCRTRLEGNIAAFLDDPRALRYLADEAGRKQRANTTTLLGIIGPKMDAIQMVASFAIKSGATLGGGLLNEKILADGTITQADIVSIKNFSLYIGDLLSVRIRNLSEYVAERNRVLLRAIVAVLSAIAISIVAVMLMVIRALGINQRLNEESTRYLESILAAIYDISGQGFITFDPLLRVDTSISRQSARLLGTDPSGGDVGELLWAGDSAREEFRQGMGLVFSGKAKPEVVFDIFENEVSFGDKHLRMNFRYLSPKRIMLALTDITREHELRELLRAEEHRKTLILKALASRFDFSSFAKDAAALLDRVEEASMGETTDDELAGLMRRVHSLKGNAGFFGFTHTAEAAHALEFEINDARILGGHARIGELGAALRESFETELGHITNLLGADWLDDLDTIHIPKRDFLLIERLLAGKLSPGDEAVSRLRSFRSVPMRSLFDRYPSMIADLAEKTGKLVHEVSIEGGEFRVIPDPFDKLMSTIVHIIRNIVDHGIESPAERDEKGKDRYATIRISIANGDRAIAATFSDDGRGIADEDVRERAIALGILKKDDRSPREALLRLLLTPGLSTAKEVTMLSGRGAGLPAVYEAVIGYGGTMDIASDPGNGTVITISIPKQRKRT